MNFEKCAANCGKFAWRNEKYCLTCLKKIAEENKNTNISELPEIKKQREMIQKNAPAERKTFWKLMQKKFMSLQNNVLKFKRQILNLLKKLYLLLF